MMDRRLLRAFQFQIADQCRFGLIAAEDAKSMPPGTQLWYGMQNLLVAAANISKALWGTGGMLTKEREPLRISLQVQDSSPLKATTMRNHWEHFDERLDIWEAKSTEHNFLDQNVGPLEEYAAQLGGIPAEIDVFRHFDDTTGILYFWGDQFPLIPILEEMSRILPIALEAANKRP
jgi:hypothetical protein